MIGSGIFMLPASLAVYGNISLLGWIISSVGAIFLAIIFGNLAKLLPNASGGPYAYTKVKLGHFSAFIVAWSYWISIWCANAAIVVALIGYLSVFFPILANNSVISIITAWFFIWLFSWINTKPIRIVGHIQLITTIFKITPILLIAFFGLFYANIHQISFDGELNFSTITAVTTLTFFAFLGMESATIPSSKVDNAETTVKRATIIGTVATVIIYSLSSVVIMSIIPPEKLTNSVAPFVDTASLFWGNSAKYIVAAGAVISTMGALNGWILIQGQIPMAAAQDKLFPSIFGKLNEYGAPSSGIIISSIFISLLITLNYFKGLVSVFTFMITLSALSVITPYLFSIISYGIILVNNSRKEFAKKIIIPLITLCFLTLIIIGCEFEVVVYGLLLLLAGIPFYIWLKKKHHL